MIRVGIIGAPGAGKTSLARSITSTCRRIDDLKRVELVAEYARRYISKHGVPNQIWEQYRIMEKQIEWEDSIPVNSTDLIITDSPVHLGFLYAMELVTPSPKDIMVYNDIFKKLTKLNEKKPRYDIIFHLPPTIKPVDDGVRASHHLDDKWRKNADQKLQFLCEVFKMGTRYITIDETELDVRTNRCIKHIEGTTL